MFSQEILISRDLNKYPSKSSILISVEFELFAEELTLFKNKTT
jgi:hypothetical protein